MPKPTKALFFKIAKPIFDWKFVYYRYLPKLFYEIWIIVIKFWFNFKIASNNLKTLLIAFKQLRKFKIIINLLTNFTNLFHTE